MDHKFRYGEYVFVREVSERSRQMNSRWDRDKLLGKEGHRIKVTYMTQLSGQPAVWAAGVYWHEDDLMSTEEHRAIAQASRITLKEKDILSVL